MGTVSEHSGDLVQQNMVVCADKARGAALCRLFTVVMHIVELIAATLILAVDGDGGDDVLQQWMQQLPPTPRMNYTSGMDMRDLLQREGARPLVVQQTPMLSHIEHWSPHQLANRLDLLFNVRWSNTSAKFTYYNRKDAARAWLNDPSASKDGASHGMAGFMTAAQFFGTVANRTSGEPPFMYAAGAIDEKLVVKEGELSMLPVLLQQMRSLEPYGHADLLSPHLWLGLPGVSATLHADTSDNTYVQLHGRKEFFLLPPAAAESVYLYPTSHPRSGQAQAHPQLSVDELHSRFPGFLPEAFHRWGERAVLEAGDVLLLPANWLHHVIALSPRDTSHSEALDPVGALSISANFWRRCTSRRCSFAMAHINPTYPGTDPSHTASNPTKTGSKTHDFERLSGLSFGAIEEKGETLQSANLDTHARREIVDSIDTETLVSLQGYLIAVLRRVLGPEAMEAAMQLSGEQSMQVQYPGPARRTYPAVVVACQEQRVGARRQMQLVCKVNWADGDTQHTIRPASAIFRGNSLNDLPLTNADKEGYRAKPQHGLCIIDTAVASFFARLFAQRYAPLLTDHEGFEQNRLNHDLPLSGSHGHSSGAAILDEAAFVHLRAGIPGAARFGDIRLEHAATEASVDHAVLAFRSEHPKIMGEAGPPGETLRSYLADWLDRLISESLGPSRTSALLAVLGEPVLLKSTNGEG